MTLPNVVIVKNVNEKGCNQYTGKDCDGVKSNFSAKHSSDDFTTHFSTKSGNFEFKIIPQREPGDYHVEFFKNSNRHTKDIWEKVFKDSPSERVSSSFKKTNDTSGLSSVPVMRKIGDLLEKFIKSKKPTRFAFTSLSSEPSRVKLYTKFSKLISKRHGYELKINERFDSVYFKFTKSITTNNLVNNLSWNEEFDLVFNANPKGCNQWTGPDCDGPSTGETNGKDNGTQSGKSTRGKEGPSKGPSTVGKLLEGAAPRSSTKPNDSRRGSGNKSTGLPIVGIIPGALDAKTVKEKIDKLIELKTPSEEEGGDKVVGWLKRLKEEVDKRGVEEVLKSTYEKPLRKTSLEEVHYQGHDFTLLGKAARDYLKSNGIIIKRGVPKEGQKAISSETNTHAPWQKPLEKGDLIPKDPGYFDKLTESKKIPGLESTEDLNKVAGKKVTHITDDVVKALDEKYGPRWVLKPYGDNAFRSKGIFFSQHAHRLKKDAIKFIESAEKILNDNGFSFSKKEERITGIKNNKTGEKISLTDKELDKEWDKLPENLKNSLPKDQLKTSLENMNGIKLPPEYDYMAQQAYEVPGASDRMREKGHTVIWGEGRVHIITDKNGGVEVIRHGTLLKGESSPTVVHTKETKEMEEAALKLIQGLPKKDRSGQLYATDMIRTTEGFKPVELNPANEVGSSGYLAWDPKVIDAYVSHIMGREPKHVQEIRDILMDKELAKTQIGDKYWGSKVQPYYHKEANPSSDAAIIRENKKGETEILLIKRSKKKADGDDNVEGGKWALPGGFHNTIAAPGETFIKSGETPRKAALRELEEETKLNLGKFVKKLQKVGVYEGRGRDPRDNKESWSQSHAFVLKLPKNFNTDSVKGSDDASKAKWVKIKDLHKIKLAFDHGKIIKDALKKAKVKMTKNSYFFDRYSVEIIKKGIYTPPNVLLLNCMEGENSGKPGPCPESSSELSPKSTDANVSSKSNLTESTAIQVIKSVIKNPIKASEESLALSKEVQKDIIKLNKPSILKDLGDKIVNAFTGELPKEIQGGIMKQLKSAANIFDEGRAELQKEYGVITGNAIAGAALLGKIAGGIVGAGVGIGVTATLVNTLGGFWVQLGDDWQHTKAQKVIEAQKRTIEKGAKVGSKLGAVLTSFPLIALAHSLRGLKNFKTPSTQGVGVANSELNITEIAKEWMQKMESKIHDSLTNQDEDKEIIKNSIPKVLIVNVNEKGCNQWTGPDCDGSNKEIPYAEGIPTNPYRKVATEDLVEKSIKELNVPLTKKIKDFFSGETIIDLLVSGYDKKASDATPKGIRVNLEKVLNSYPAKERVLKENSIYEYTTTPINGSNKILDDFKKPESDWGPRTNEVVRDINELIDKAGEFHPVRVFRGINIPKDKQIKLLEAMKSCLEKGKEFSLPGLVSTSFSKKIADQFSSARSFSDALFNKSLKFVIIAKKGLPVKKYSKFPDEEELLLSNKAKFKVRNITKNSIVLEQLS